jgi:hypothetical protein
MNGYEQQAEKFLQDFNLKISLKKGANKNPCNWECGNSYLVTIEKGERKLSFDFHDSINNQQMGSIPSHYDILACIYSESYCPDTLEEFNSEYGYEGNNGKKIFKFLKIFSKKINKFFTAEELERLEEI